MHEFIVDLTSPYHYSTSATVWRTRFVIHMSKNYTKPGLSFLRHKKAGYAAENTSRSHQARLLAPAFIVLLLNIVLSFFIGDILFESSRGVIYRILFRFIRFTLLLCLPLYLLPPLFRLVTDKMRRRLVQGETSR